MFSVENHGTLVLIQPHTVDVEAWLKEHTDGQWFGGALVCEPRYVEQLVIGLITEGGFALQ